MTTAAKHYKYTLYRFCEGYWLHFSPGSYLRIIFGIKNDAVVD